jgi:hypothetical protein
LGTERAVKKVRRDEAGRPDGEQMLQELRSHLRNMADIAKSLSEELGRSGKRPSRQEKDVLHAAIDSKIKGLMEEAKFFALTDEPDNFRCDMEMVMDWMEMKADM